MDLIALGEPLLEMNAPEGHDLATAPHFAVGFGGDTSNAAIAAARAGAATGYVTHIGDDQFGTAKVSTSLVWCVSPAAAPGSTSSPATPRTARSPTTGPGRPRA